MYSSMNSAEISVILMLTCFQYLSYYHYTITYLGKVTSSSSI